MNGQTVSSIESVTRARTHGSRMLWKQYLKRLIAHFEAWSKKYTDLRLTSDIRVASYKGQRLQGGHQGREWWLREVLNEDARQPILAPNIIMLGDPGAGKTTACQHAVWTLSLIHI